MPDMVVLEAEMIVELAQLVGPDADLRARLVIGVVAIGHHGVEPVIAAGEFDHDEDAAGLRRRRRGGLRKERRAAETGGAEDDAAEAGAQKVAPRHAADARENRHVRLQFTPICRSRRVRSPASAELEFGCAHDQMRGEPQRPFRIAGGAVEIARCRAASPGTRSGPRAPRRRPAPAAAAARGDRPRRPRSSRPADTTASERSNCAAARGIGLILRTASWKPTRLP